MPPEPSVTSACEGPRSCTLRYSSALLPKSFERPGPKSVSPATNCSGVEVVVWCRWIVAMCRPPLENEVRSPRSVRREDVILLGHCRVAREAAINGAGRIRRERVGRGDVVEHRECPALRVRESLAVLFD